jgi:hypothetical protein
MSVSPSRSLSTSGRGRTPEPGGPSAPDPGFASSAAWPDAALPAALSYAGASGATYSRKDVLARGDSLQVAGDAYVRGGGLSGKPPEFGVRSSAEYLL